MDLNSLKALVAALPPGEWDLETAYGGNREMVALQLVDNEGRVIVETSNSDVTLYEVCEESDEDGASFFVDGSIRKALEFCAAAHTAVPELIAEVERLRESCANLLDLQRERSED